MPEREHVGVIGAGSWGTTLAKILGENGAPTLLWAHEPEVADEVAREHRNSRYLPDVELSERVEGTTDLARVCESARLLFAVIPSHVFRGVARSLGDHLHGEHVVVHATKGIEQETFKRMSEVLREETCVRKLGVICGPNLAKELAGRQPAGTLVASRFQEVVALAQRHLSNGYFRVYGGADVIGAEVGGAFKNIVALAAGVADGLELGENTKALLLTRGLSEMARFGQSMGAQVMTFGGMAGIGDLMATCASPLSRNHQVGERLGRGETLEAIQASMFMVAEGVKTTRSVHAYAHHMGLDLPIVRAAHGLIYEGKGVNQVIQELLAREVKEEFFALEL